MSPTQPPMPADLGSVRQAACLWPFRSSLCEPILGIFGLHQADIAELAILHHFARLPDHRIAGVIMGKREDQTPFFLELRSAPSPPARL